MRFDEIHTAQCLNYRQNQIKQKNRKLFGQISALICVNLRIIFVSLSDRTQDIQFKLFLIIYENNLVPVPSGILMGKISPQSTQRAQSLTIPVITYDMAASSRFRTRMTRIARIFTNMHASALEKPQRAQRTQRNRQCSVLSECSVVLDSWFLPMTRTAS